MNFRQMAITLLFLCLGEQSECFREKMNDDSEPVRVSNSKDRDVAGFYWKDNNLLYVKDKGGDENFHIYSTTFNGSEEKDLTPYPNVTVGILSGLQGVKDEILIMMNKEDATVFDVYKLNVKTGETTHVAKILVILRVASRSQWKCTNCCSLRWCGRNDSLSRF